MMEPEAEVSSPTSLPTSLRFRCSSMLVPGQWHHLAVVMAKDVKKSCLTSVYFNGKAVGTGKVWWEETDFGAALILALIVAFMYPCIYPFSVR